VADECLYCNMLVLQVTSLCLAAIAELTPGGTPKGEEEVKRGFRAVRYLLTVLTAVHNRCK
jgi:hypothetical protein